MNKVLKVFFVDDVNHPIAENLSREIPVSDIDTMRKTARKLLTAAGFFVRSVNFHQDGSIVAYIQRNVETRAKPVDGWVFKKPNLKSTT